MRRAGPGESGNRVAVVTGSTGGIGKAVALGLASPNTSLCLTGRDAEKLERAAREIEGQARRVVTYRADLRFDESIRGLVERVNDEFGRLDILVHAAGVLCLGNIEAAGWNDLDDQYRVNLRAPFLLTKAFVPMLKQSRGEVVFINSSSGITAGAENGLYGATKQALRSLAGSIRDHLNPRGIRVLSVFPGRTATPMQEVVQHFEGRAYPTADLLQPSDVAAVIVAALALPRTAELTDVMLRPMKKATAGRSDR